MPSKHDIYLSILYEAIGQPIGIELYTNDLNAARSVLNNAKLKSDDPQLSNIQIRQSPKNPNEIWIVNQKIQLPKETKTNDQ